MTEVEQVESLSAAYRRDLDTERLRVKELEAKLKEATSIGYISKLEQSNIERQAKLERIKNQVKAAYEIAFDSPELNMSNYDEDQVAALNHAMTVVCVALEEALEDTDD